jgi:hypothetical protein
MNIKYFQAVTFLWITLWLGLIYAEVLYWEEEIYSFIIFPLVGIWGAYFILKK